MVDNPDGWDPNSIHKETALAEKDDYMYFGCIAFIKQVKAVYTNKDGEISGEKIFATAGDKHDKTVQLWDMTTLKNVATLKGHRGEIRALEFSKDGKYLFSAGMGGMLVWDTRNTQAPIELIEKHKDVFALKTTSSQLFLGCRDHSIVPVGLSYSALSDVQQKLARERE